jgi:hypothetical protein
MVPVVGVEANESIALPGQAEAVPIVTALVVLVGRDFDLTIDAGLTLGITAV